MLRYKILRIASTVLFFSIFTAVIGTTNANAATIQIPCGPGVSYSLDISTGVASDGGGCTHSLTLDSRVTSIGDYAFAGSYLETLTTSSALTSIGDFAFNGQPLKSLTLNSALTSIGDGAFSSALLTSLTLNSALTTVGPNAFHESPLTSLTLNSALASVGNDAFFSALIPAFILSSTSETVTVGTAIAGYTISSFGVPIVSYSISPDIGNDLSFDTSTGLISGTPSTAVNLVTYTITGSTDGAGSTSRPYSINIKSKTVSTPTPSVPSVPTAQSLHEQQVERAKNEILASIIFGKLLTPNQLLQADFFGATLKNIGDINNEILSLDKSKKMDLKEIGKIVDKYAIVDNISNNGSFYFPDLIKIGLVNSETPNRASILRELKGLNSDQLDTYEKIQAAIKNIQAKINERKAMIASRLARIRK